MAGVGAASADSMRDTPERVSAKALLPGLAFAALFTPYLLAALALLALGLGGALAAALPGLHDYFHEVGLGFGPVARAAERMGRAAHLERSWAQIAFDYVFTAFNLSLAAFLLWLRPRDRTARLLAMGMVGTAAAFNLQALSALEALPLTPGESIMSVGFHLVAGLAYAAALLAFPDGRFVPRWPAPALLLAYAPIVAGAVFLALRAEGGDRPTVLILFFGLIVPIAGVAAQAYRFERSPTPAEHQQARLLFWALLPALALGLGFVATQALSGSLAAGTFAGRPISELPEVAFRVFQPVFAIVPVALFIGLLRYRLWDIDRVINRTIVYTAVTALLATAYLGIVVLLQRVFSPLTQTSDLAVAASTLAVAGAFRPARTRVQAFVDRRFYRRRYDAARTIEAYGARLRDCVDLQTLSRELEAVIHETVEPTCVTLWLLPKPESSNGAGNRPATETRNDSQTVDSY